MAISQAMCTSFKVELLNGIHAFSTTVARGNTNADSFKLALYTSSASLGAGTTAYTTSGEASGTGYTAAGAALAAEDLLATASVPTAVVAEEFVDKAGIVAVAVACGSVHPSHRIIATINATSRPIKIAPRMLQVKAQPATTAARMPKSAEIKAIRGMFRDVSVIVFSLPQGAPYTPAAYPRVSRLFRRSDSHIARSQMPFGPDAL